MLTTPTLTQEAQRYYCLDRAERNEFDLSSLSELARV